MRVVFTGSSDFSLVVLRALIASRHAVVGAITQPDRPQGRGRKVQPSPVKAEALARGITVWTPEKAGDEAFLETLRAARPDVVAVAAYGQILTRRFLEIPPRGCVNVHPSLVPRYRGASPVAYAVLNGDAVTGVSIFHVVPKLDAGPVYARREAAIAPDETAGELEARLAPIGSALLIDVLDAIEAGTAHAEAQDESQVVLAPKLEKDQGRVAWTEPAARIARLIRAMNPWPGAIASFRGAGHPGTIRVKLLRAVPAAWAIRGSPGAVLAVAKDGLVVAAGEGPSISPAANTPVNGEACAVRITELQPEGKRLMTARDFANGYRVLVGDRFESAGPPG